MKHSPNNPPSEQKEPSGQNRPNAPAAALPAAPEAPLLPAPKRSEEDGFPIVAIGASAGGLAAIEAFFSALSKLIDHAPGMAFVIVQHLSPDHKSLLTELVKRYTSLGVIEAENGLEVRANCVYIIPPNRDMRFVNGRLNLIEPQAPRGQRLPIDFFFRSLAQEKGERAICIILSGTGSDGTLGVRAIKGEGGMVMVQTPESADYDGMPRSAMATGLVDFVSPPAEMPGQLLGYLAHAPHNAKTPASKAEATTPENALAKIHVVLRTQTGHDFSHYKRNTVERRILRRMAVHQISQLDEYLSFLQKSPAEAEALFRELLIGVTSFFRDPEVFEIFGKEVIPAIVKSKPAGSIIRVWVPGCSTGEEAYSIAILLNEQIEALRLDCKVQIFATDIDSRAIAVARAGVYPASIASDVTKERLGRFFRFISKEPGKPAYRIQKTIRDMLIFSEHDLIKDPPFSKVDLISCRNVLIYMDGELQRQIIPLFHYALNPDGFLFLGTSEGVGDFANHFSTAHRKEKIYRKKDLYHKPTTRPLTSFLLQSMEKAAPKTPGEEKTLGAKTSVRDLVEGMLLRQFAPVAALVNRRGDILYLHGRSGFLLEPAPGEAGVNNILRMAREGLQRPLTMALQKAAKNEEPACSQGVRVKSNGHYTTINLTVQPAPISPNDAAESALYLVVLENAPDKEVPPQKAHQLPEGKEKESAGDAESVDERIAALELELRSKEEYIRSTKEELETSNEELKSSNEEMQSINEELQSTNEELETAKEESQSVNEELATVNTELQAKVSDLSQAYNDINNLLAGTGLGTIFVDHHQRIKRFTPSVTEVISFISTDVGRPLGDIASNLVNYSRLHDDVQLVLDTLVPQEIEVQTKNGDWYLLGIRPYRTLENMIEGAVITFVNISGLKKSQLLLQETENRRHLAEMLFDVRDAIIAINAKGAILAWNRAAASRYGWSEEEALKMNFAQIVPEQAKAEALEKIQALASSKTPEPQKMQRLTKDGRTLKVWVNASTLAKENGEEYAIATTERLL